MAIFGKFMVFHKQYLQGFLSCEALAASDCVGKLISRFWEVVSVDYVAQFWLMSITVLYMYMCDACSHGQAEF